MKIKKHEIQTFYIDLILKIEITIDIITDEDDHVEILVKGNTNKLTADFGNQLIKEKEQLINEGYEIIDFVPDRNHIKAIKIINTIDSI